MYCASFYKINPLIHCILYWHEYYNKKLGRTFYEAYSFGDFNHKTCNYWFHYNAFQPRPKLALCTYRSCHLFVINWGFSNLCIWNIRFLNKTHCHSNSRFWNTFAGKIGFNCMFLDIAWQNYTITIWLERTVLLYKYVMVSKCTI